MAGQNSKSKKGQKARAGGGKKQTPRAPRPESEEEEEYSGTMMGLRSGFKKVAAGESGKKGNPIWNWLSWAALAAAILFVFNRFAC